MEEGGKKVKICPDANIISGYIMLSYGFHLLTTSATFFHYFLVTKTLLLMEKHF